MIRAGLALSLVLLAGCTYAEERQSAAQRHLGAGAACSLPGTGDQEVACIRDGRRWTCVVADPGSTNPAVACAPWGPPPALPAEMPQ